MSVCVGHLYEHFMVHGSLSLSVLWLCLSDGWLHLVPCMAGVLVSHLFSLVIPRLCTFYECDMSENYFVIVATRTIFWKKWFG